MNINRRRQSQFELFPGEPKTPMETGKRAQTTKDLTLSLENIIVLCIIFVMSLVLFFSLGVEKGKRVAMKRQKTLKAAVAKKAEVPETPKAGPQVDEKRVVFPVELPPEIASVDKAAPSQPIEIFDEPQNLFTIQVASFKLASSAQKEAERLKGFGHDDAFVIAKGNYSIVCVGKFAKKTEARKFSSKLQNRYNDCLVRRL